MSAARTQEPLEPLKITQLHAALEEDGKWQVTARSQRSRITLHGRVDPIPALHDAANRVLRGEDDDEWTDEPGPVPA